MPVLVGALVALSGVPLATAARSCGTSCLARMRSCRAERCSAVAGKNRPRHCRDICRAVTGCAAGAARIRTLAAVVTECRASAGTWTGRQRLEIRRGDCPPVTVSTVEGDEAAPDTLGICRIYGQLRAGTAAHAVGAFQGLAVSPDGKTVLVQVTDDFAGRLAIGGFAVPSPALTPAAEGIFVVRSDGTGLRRIAEQSREAPFAVVPTSEFPFVDVNITDSNGFSFSPDGTSVVFSDRGPGADGSDAPQLVTLDPNTGTRRQLTTFTASSAGISPRGLTLDAVFLDDDRIGGRFYDRIRGSRIFRMRRDGTDLQYFDAEAPASVPGAMLTPSFRVSGLLSDVFELVLPMSTDQPRPGPVQEIFVRDGKNLLQLTRAGRSDTRFPLRLRDREHVLFAASGDLVKGTNPSLTCQLFSVDVLGGHLRQLTNFEPAMTAPGGCARPSTTGCTLATALNVQDQVTGAIVFDSSCNPLDPNAVTQQIYALRIDGSGFRQLTDYRGMTSAPDGVLSVELPGPVVYQAPLK